LEQRLSNESALSLAGVGFGAAGVCFLDVLGLLASPAHDAVFHRVGSSEAQFVPAVADLLLLSAVIFLGLYAVRGRPRWRRVVWSGLLASLPWIGLKSIAFLMEKTLPHWASLGVFGVCAGLAVASAFWVRAATFEAMRDFGRVLLLALAVPAALATTEVVVYGFEARHLNDAVLVAPEAPSVARSSGGGRVVWLVLDELAYRQAFERQPRGVSLPEFDRLKAETTLFTQVTAAAQYTEIALPSLMAGHAANALHLSADGQHLRLRAGGGAWWAFDEHDTVFADARALGYRTAVVGWYEPYCRILPTVLTSCYWTGQNKLSGMFPGQSIGANMVHPLVRLVRRVPNFLLARSGPSAEEISEGSRHVDDFVRLEARSDEVLARDESDFMLLHMPVPHPTGIYDRRLKTYAVDRSNYVDNLALADAYLGRVRRELEAKGEWDGATVVVMGDHSWRTELLWKGHRPWSAEDEEASAAGVDARPAYAVKLPHQTRGAVIATSFAAVRTRALLGALLRGQIADADGLQRWVDAGQ
jgi:hypothetical protein